MASKKMNWAGYVLSTLVVLLMVMSAVMKLMKSAQVVEGFTHYGIPEGIIVKLGILELACTILYVIPRTCVLGAILLTGYLGGATLTSVRVGEAFIMPVIVGVVAWGGIFLRDERVRALIPFRR